jgi:tetratricopeptide (TPR) repeat protein
MAKRDCLFIFVLLTVLFLLYQSTFEYDLIWDTKLFVNEGVLFKGDVSWFSVFTYGYIYDQLGIGQQSFYYRPIVNLSFFLENKLWGLGNSQLRLFNLFVFSLILIFLFIFLKKQERGWPFAVLITSLFALSPLNSENIIWVVGRCDLFLLLWGILSWLFLQLYIERDKKTFLFYSVGFYIMGIYSKETFLFFLPLLLVYEWIKTKKITPVYHVSNLMVTLMFFWVKNGVLGIRSLSFSLPPIFTSLYTGISVLGYYGSLLCFPVGFETFNFAHKVTSIQYFMTGIFFIFLIFAVVLFSKKDRKNWTPVALTVIFILPYILLVFTSLWPFKISARYMMLPFLGLIWLLVGYLVRLKKWIQTTLILLLMVLFVQNVISVSSRYHSERDYWEHALTDHPDSSFVNLKAAEACYEEWDDFSAQLYLTRALKYPMGQVTAIGIAVAFAKIEYQRMEYEKSLVWLDKITFNVLPVWKYQIDKLKARIYLARGDVRQAQITLKSCIEQFNERLDLYQLLIGMYIGHNKWDKAREWQLITAKKFPGIPVPDIDKTEKSFYQMSEEEKMGFYIHYTNYHKAIQILRESEIEGMDKKLLLVELYYKSGQPALGKYIIDQLISENPDNWEMANTVGFFYSKKIRRPAEALSYFQLSVKIKKDQPKITRLISALTIQLRKL